MHGSVYGENIMDGNHHNFDNIEAPADYARPSQNNNNGNFSHTKNHNQNGISNGNTVGQNSTTRSFLGENGNNNNFSSHYIMPPSIGINPEAFQIQNDDPRRYTSTNWRLEPSVGARHLKPTDELVLFQNTFPTWASLRSARSVLP